MIIALATVLVLVVQGDQIVSEITPMICGGTLHSYLSSATESDIEFGAATLDFANKRLVTPVGNFRITKVDDASITFDKPDDKLKVFGTLDRLTGTMNAFLENTC